MSSIRTKNWLGLFALVSCVGFPSLAWTGESAEVTTPFPDRPHLVSEISAAREALKPTIVFATPGISETSDWATGLTVNDVLRLTEVGRAPVFFERGSLIIHNVSPEARAAVKKAVAAGKATVKMEGPDKNGIASLVISGPFRMRQVGVRQLGYGFAVPRATVGKTLLRVPVKVTGVRGNFGATLSFHSGPRKGTPLPHSP